MWTAQLRIRRKQLLRERWCPRYIGSRILIILVRTTSAFPLASRLARGVAAACSHSALLVDGGFFVFGDLSVKLEGEYRLLFSLFEMRKYVVCLPPSSTVIAGLVKLTASVGRTSSISNPSCPGGSQVSLNPSSPRMAGHNHSPLTD